MIKYIILYVKNIMNFDLKCVFFSDFKIKHVHVYLKAL